MENRTFIKEPASVPDEALLCPLTAEHGTIFYMATGKRKVRSLVPFQPQRTLIADPQLLGCPQRSMKQPSIQLVRKSGKRKIRRRGNSQVLQQEGLDSQVQP